VLWKQVARKTKETSPMAAPVLTPALAMCAGPRPREMGDTGGCRTETA